MSGYDNFKARTFIDGMSSRESKINDARHIMKLEFDTDPAYCNSMFLWIPGKKPHKGDKIGIRLFDRKYSSANGHTAQFDMLIDNSPNVGDYYFDEKHNQYWICTELFNENDILYNGKLTLCNWTLKWQDEQGNILEYPCHEINSTQYNSGETGDKTMTLGSAQHMATVQATPDTISLHSPRRFFISRDYSIPFIVTQNDTTAGNYGRGLCKITLTQDQLRQTDKQEMGICDYFAPAPLPPIVDVPDETPDGSESEVLTAYIEGDEELRVDRYRTYSVLFPSSENIEYTWNIVADFEIKSEIYENKIKLLIEDENFVGNSFLLQVVSDNKVITEKKIFVVGAF